MKQQNGLTLVELLIVIVVVAILAAVAFVVIDPAGRLAEERNGERWAEVNTIMAAVQDAFADTEGELTGDLMSIDTTAATVQIITDGPSGITCIATCASETVAATNCEADLSGLAEKYFAAVPIDPTSGGTDSRYYINYDDGVFTVGACDPEKEKDGTTPTIEVSR